MRVFPLPGRDGESLATSVISTVERSGRCGESPISARRWTPHGVGKWSGMVT